MASCCWAGAALAGPAAAQAACSATAPAANAATPTSWQSDQDIINAFTAARAAEGCTTPFTLPAGYDTMTPQQQVQALVNSEREVRGLPDIQLDTTLLGQLAQNHSQQMATYGFFDNVDPWGNFFANDIGFEPALEGPFNVDAQTVIAQGLPPSEAVYNALYLDASSPVAPTLNWADRGNLLNATYNWMGVGIAASAQGVTYTTIGAANIAQFTPNYKPPATADTNSPVVSNFTYSNGTASVTAVDSPLNVNDVNYPFSTTDSIMGVAFYTNNLVETGGAFNDVQGTAAGTNAWTAPITVNPGDVVHALVENGSGVVTDVTLPPPPATLNAGANNIALPAAATTPAAAAATARDASAASSPVAAVTPTAAALVASVDKQAGSKVVLYIRIYVDGHWRTYYPGKSASFAIYAGEGVDLQLKRKVKWQETTKQLSFTAPIIRLHRGWNFVAVPYPVTGMTCHAVRLELAHAGDRLEEISIGATPNTGVIMKPHNGQWGNDLGMHIPYNTGFWILDAGSDNNWVPSPVQFVTITPEIK